MITDNNQSLRPIVNQHFLFVPNINYCIVSEYIYIVYEHNLIMNEF